MFYRRKIKKLKKELKAIKTIVAANNEFLNVIYEALTDASPEEAKTIKGFKHDQQGKTD